MRQSYLRPLMVYLAAEIFGFTGIIESFTVKEELGLSAEFLAGSPGRPRPGRRRFISPS